MRYAKQMIETRPRASNVDTDILVSCIEACYACAQACTACADACLSEEDVAELVTCIRTDLDCADVCETTGRVLSRQTGYDANLTRSVLQACAQACRSCGAECDRHAEMGMEHCRVCAEACRSCEQACTGLLEAMQAMEPMEAMEAMEATEAMEAMEAMEGHGGHGPPPSCRCGKTFACVDTPQGYRVRRSYRHGRTRCTATRPTRTTTSSGCGA